MPYNFCEKIGNEIRDISDEIPFDIPDNWCWCKMGICLDVRDGTHDTPKYVPKGIPLVTSKNLCNGSIDFSTAKFISLEDHEAISQRSKVDTDDIMFAMIGSIGNPVLYRGNEVFSIKNMALFKKIKNGIDMEYVYWFLYTSQGDMKKYASGGVQSFVSLNYLRNYYISIPPLAEQKRIVAKIEELMPYIEKYEQAEKQLTKLNETFPEMLKKSILQQAVQGKLVPQNPDDEPASILLERIRAEKQSLIKAGKIKKDKHESVIITRDKIPYEITDGKERCIADEVPFEIPDNWCWCRFGIISTYNQMKQKINAKDADASIWELNLEDIEKGGRLLVQKTVGERKAVGDKTMFSKGDILYSKLRPYLLKILVAPNSGICTPEIVPFNVYSGISADYIVNFLKSPYVDRLVNGETYGIKMPRVGTETMISLFVPLPPIKEQYRIVSKIEEIMPIINTISK